MHRSLSTGIRTRSALAAGLLLVAGTAVAAAPSATAATTTASQAARTAVLTPNDAHYSGRAVSGEVTGAAARAGHATASQAFLRAHGEADATSAPAPSPADDTTTSTYEHQWWGIEVSTLGTTMTGEQATHTADADLRMTNSSDYLYSPTTKPRYGSCIEITTAHTSTYAEVWAWDWCAADSGIGAYVDITSSWLATYSPGGASGDGAYTLRIVQADAATNAWTAYLYNYQTDSWDTFYTSSGTDQATAEFGWDEFEYYSYLTSDGDSYLCSGYAGHTTGSSGIEIRDANGNWSPGSASNTVGLYPYASINGTTYHCPTLSSSVTPDTAWSVSDS